MTYSNSTLLNFMSPFNIIKDDVCDTNDMLAHVIEFAIETWSDDICDTFQDDTKEAYNTFLNLLVDAQNALQTLHDKIEVEMESE